MLLVTVIATLLFYALTALSADLILFMHFNEPVPDM